MKGRKRLPTAMHQLNGNPSKIKGLDEINEPQPSTDMPTCPSFLDATARTEWKRVCPELHRLGLLTLLDRAALAGYCAAYSRWVRAEKEIQKEFSYQYRDLDYKTKQSKKPEVQIAIDSLNQVKAFCAEFGLTPSSRARMQVPGKSKESEDPIEKLLGCQN